MGQHNNKVPENGWVVQKVSTGLTGLAVNRHPQQTLKALYNKILFECEKMPAGAAYKVNTMQIINERLELVKANDCPVQLEQKINCGQIEEVIQQAKRELRLCRNMLKWKPWEPLVGPAPQNQWTWPLN